MTASPRLLLCALAAALLGCGGGSSGNSGNPPPPPPSATVTVQASPEAFVIPPNGQASLLASVEGTPNQSVIWSSTAGQVTQAGMFTPPATKSSLTIQAASVVNPASTAEIQVFVDDDEIASSQASSAVASSGIWPTAIMLAVDQAAMLLGFGGNAADLRWALEEGASAGSIASQGSLAGLALARYQAPATGGVFHVSLTSAVDASMHARARITVRGRGQVSVSVLPSSATLLANGSRSFKAQVTGTSNHGVTWSATSGSITAAGIYTAPSAPGTATVRATSVADTTKFAEATVTVHAAPPPPPSGYLLLTANRLDQIRADAAANKVAWTNLHANVEASLSSTDQYDTGAENMAMAYLVSGDARYAARAYWWSQQAMSGSLRADSYYYFQSMVRPVAMTLNYCQPALSASQLQVLKDYLHASCDELWYHNQGSGWGLDDPANNYHLSFLAGTAFAGAALKASGDSRGQAWLDLLNDKLTHPNGVFAYLDQIQGGDWEEGANYGEGSKAHLAICLSVLAGSGTNHFSRAFFAGSVRYAVYATQPGGNFLYPGGDLARESAMGVSPYTRAYLQPTVFWLGDGPERRLGQWYLTHVAPTYLDGNRSFNYRTGLWLDLAFRLEIPETPPDAEPLSYHAAGTEWLNARSGWDADATSLSISGAPRIAQSHQHQDTGHFVMWKRDWLAADASTYSHSGLLWEPQGQNLLKVPGVVMHFDESPTPGLRRQIDRGSFFYAQVDATNLYKRLDSNNQYETLLNEHTREFIYLRPDTLVVFDRVDAKPAGVGYQWLMHFPEAPSASGGRYLLNRNGASIALQTLMGGSGTVVPDTDLETSTTSSRVEVEATGATSRFLHLLQVAAGSAPASVAQLVNVGSMKGLLWNDTVVLFSDLPHGSAPSLPLTYTLPGTAIHTHILANLSGSFDVEVARSGSTTTLTLRAGSAHTADANGLLTFTDAGGAQAPSISSFIATPSTIISGQSSTLSWVVSGVTALSIDHGVGAVTGTSRIVSPGVTTTYQLTATNAAGSATATATVTVDSAPSGGCGTLDLGLNSNLHGYRAFPSTSAWNQNISAVPADPNSDSIIAFIGATSGLKADFGSGLWEGSSIGIPYGVVSGSQAKVAIAYQAYGDESDPGPMPVPDPAPIEGDDPHGTSGDRHVLLLDRDNCILYELYGSQLQTNGSWNADSGAIWDLQANTLRPFGWTSADAAGLPIFPGLARFDEVAAGAITHALRFTVPSSRRAYVFPASHWASSNTSASAPPMGMRVRLKASVDISGYPAQSRVLLQALKTYGMILADNGSRWFISGAPNAGWDNTDLQSLSGIKGSDLEVVQMGTIHTADPTGAAPTIAFSASPAAITAGQSSTLNWTVTDTSTVLITPNLGPPIGLVRGTSLVVNPGATTTYMLTATGPYGRTTSTATVTVAM